jgi:plastocyanin
MRTACLFAFGVLLLACPGGRGGDAAKNSPAKSSTNAVNPQAVPENSTAMNPVVEPNKDNPTKRGVVAAQPVNVQLLEYEIRMPNTIPAGPQTLSITNGGKEPHSLAITGTGFNQQLGTQLQRGDTTTLDVNLEPGSYTFFCPVDGDAAKGMKRTVTVK